MSHEKVFRYGPTPRQGSYQTSFFASLLLVFIVVTCSYFPGFLPSRDLLLHIAGDAVEDSLIIVMRIALAHA